MNNENLGTIIKERLKELPPIVQKAIAEINFTQEMIRIQKKYALSLDKVADLEVETMIIMLGLDESDNFISNLQENLGIEKTVALAIENDLSNSIFKKIKESMVSLSEKEPENEELLNKNDILEQIENPVPSQIIPNKLGSSLVVEKKPITEAENKLENYTPPALPVKSIIEQKLTAPTRIPPKETQIQTTKLPQSTQTTKTDPYKEPIA